MHFAKSSSLLETIQHEIYPFPCERGPHSIYIQKLRTHKNATSKKPINMCFNSITNHSSKNHGRKTPDRNLMRDDYDYMKPVKYRWDMLWQFIMNWWQNLISSSLHTDSCVLYITWLSLLQKFTTWKMSGDFYDSTQTMYSNVCNTITWMNGDFAHVALMRWMETLPMLVSWDENLATVNTHHNIVFLLTIPLHVAGLQSQCVSVSN